MGQKSLVNRLYDGEYFLKPSGMSTKRRALVLGDEAARHPFLASLPPHVRKADRDPDVRSHTNGSGWRDFLTAYSAGLVVFAVYFA